MSISKRQAFFGLACRYPLWGLVVLSAISIFFSGCETMESAVKIGKSIGGKIDVLDGSQKESIIKSAEAVVRSFKDITPEQEYYIGRAVGATILDKYRPYYDKEANNYLNILGQTLSRASDLPETFGGYHFLILDSDEINAFAAPGGLIFVTRGLLRCCKHEDAAAAVLAHEIGHVELRHGLQAIKKSRITEALTTLGIEGAKTFGGENLSRLTETFEDSISDITKTLINNGYSRSFERQADIASVTILKRLGYGPNALVDMLRVMEKSLEPGGLDFAKTHPSPGTRIADIQKVIEEYTEAKIPGARQARFIKALGGI